MVETVEMVETEVTVEMEVMEVSVAVVVMEGMVVKEETSLLRRHNHNC